MPELIGPLDPSDKSRGVATALASLLGAFGAHRFYVGKTGSGALMAALFKTNDRCANIS